jgi:hypothetical protein
MSRISDLINEKGRAFGSALFINQGNPLLSFRKWIV